jgi:hypothetical protein
LSFDKSGKTLCAFPVERDCRMTSYGMKTCSIYIHPSYGELFVRICPENSQFRFYLAKQLPISLALAQPLFSN